MVSDIQKARNGIGSSIPLPLLFALGLRDGTSGEQKIQRDNARLLNVYVRAVEGADLVLCTF
jgi:hypothetical protein